MINKVVFRAKFYTNTFHPAKYRKKHQQKTHKITTQAYFTQKKHD